MIKHFAKIFIIILFSSLMTACISLGNVSHKQAKILKQEGFVLTEEGWSLGLPENLLFEFNDYQIPHQTKDKITHLSAQLLKYDLQKLKIIGHTDDIGTADYNIKLSEKRAETIKQLFLEQGFKDQNIMIIGRGSSQPLIENSNEENRAINRRVNIIIIP